MVQSFMFEIERIAKKSSVRCQPLGFGEHSEVFVQIGSSSGKDDPIGTTL